MRPGLCASAAALFLFCACSSNGQTQVPAPSAGRVVATAERNAAGPFDPNTYFLIIENTFENATLEQQTESFGQTCMKVAPPPITLHEREAYAVKLETETKGYCAHERPQIYLKFSVVQNCCSHGHWEREVRWEGQSGDRFPHQWVFWSDNGRSHDIAVCTAPELPSLAVTVATTLSFYKC